MSRYNPDDTHLAFVARYDSLEKISAKKFEEAVGSILQPTIDRLYQHYALVFWDEIYQMHGNGD